MHFSTSWSIFRYPITLTNNRMDTLLQKCNLPVDEQKVIKEKEPRAFVILASSYKSLQGKQIPENIIQSIVAGRKALSLEECQIIFKNEAWSK